MQQVLCKKSNKHHKKATPKVTEIQLNSKTLRAKAKLNLMAVSSLCCTEQLIKLRAKSNLKSKAKSNTLSITVKNDSKINTELELQILLDTDL